MQYTVQSRTESRLPRPVAAAAVGGALMQAPITAGWQEALQADALLSAMGLQTLGLTQVPATHLGIAGQDL